MSVLIITLEDIDYAVVIGGIKYAVYKKKKYKPVARFFSSSEAIQHARENGYSLIVSITEDEKPSRWLIMKREVVTEK